MRRNSKVFSFVLRLRIDGDDERVIFLDRVYRLNELDRVIRSIDVKGVHIDIDLRGSVEEEKKDD